MLNSWPWKYTLIVSSKRLGAKKKKKETRCKTLHQAKVTIQRRLQSKEAEHTIENEIKYKKKLL